MANTSRRPIWAPLPPPFQPRLQGHWTKHGGQWLIKAAKPPYTGIKIGSRVTTDVTRRNNRTATLNGTVHDSPTETPLGWHNGRYDQYAQTVIRSWWEEGMGEAEEYCTEIIRMILILPDHLNPNPPGPYQHPDYLFAKQWVNEVPILCAIQLPQCTQLATQIDHIVPLAKNGRADHTNLQPSCQHCNLSKGAKILRPKRALQG